MQGHMLISPPPAPAHHSGVLRRAARRILIHRREVQVFYHYIDERARQALRFNGVYLSDLPPGYPSRSDVPPAWIVRFPSNARFDLAAQGVSVTLPNGARLWHVETPPYAKLLVERPQPATWAQPQPPPPPPMRMLPPSRPPLRALPAPVLPAPGGTRPSPLRPVSAPPVVAMPMQRAGTSGTLERRRREATDRAARAALHTPATPQRAPAFYHTDRRTPLIGASARAGVPYDLRYHHDAALASASGSEPVPDIAQMGTAPLEPDAVMRSVPATRSRPLSMRMPIVTRQLGRDQGA